MAAHASEAPVAANEPAPPPAVGGKAESAAGGATKIKDEHAPAPGDDDDDDGGMWDSASLYEEILDEVEAFEYSSDGVDVCTAEEARRLRQRLHEVGASQFVLENITSEKMTARKLCTAFGVKIPRWLEDAKDEGFYQLLGLAINRELNKRPRLPQYKTMDDAAALLRERKNIMVITGAGISTSLGIPDFRSKNTGFYSRLRQMGYDEPEEVFDIHNFDDNPAPFTPWLATLCPISKSGRPHTSSYACCRTRTNCLQTTRKTSTMSRHMLAYARRS
ncbi:hypothetical protein P3342_003166 [Pyrenophora teres f. teres]|nr:hypothetical protein P3342_003166 [Pyrenophora teres f. teres]